MSGRGQVDQAGNHWLGCIAGADRRDGLLPPHAHVGGDAWPVRLGSRTDALSLDGMIVAASTTLPTRARAVGGSLP